MMADIGRAKRVIIILIVSAISMAGSAGGKELKIAVDPRIELLSAVQILSDYAEHIPLITFIEHDYKKDMESYFAPYKNHKAVEVFMEMYGTFNCDAPPLAMLFLSDPPLLKTRIPFTREICDRAGGREKLNEFVEALRNFAVESDFMSFFHDHENLCTVMVDQSWSLIGRHNLIADIENYYGMTNASYSIILAPLFHNGGYGARVAQPNGILDIYELRGPGGMENGRPTFGTTEIFRKLCWHEFSHSFVNRITQEHETDLMTYENLFKPISRHMARRLYARWIVCVNEHIVRAVTIRLTHKHLGKEAADELLAEEESEHFAYIKDLIERLKEYENNRDRYKSFVSFYPRIIDLFRELHGKNLGPEYYAVPFSGSIGEAMAEDPVIFVYPTNESSPERQLAIFEYVESRWTRFNSKYNADAQLVSDSQALGMDLSAYTLVIYGTVTGNLLINILSPQIYSAITPDNITTDTTIYGNNLRLICALPNPQNICKGMCIYTAQKADDIPGIHAVRYSTSDFAVARDTAILDSGDFVHNDDGWLFPSADLLIDPSTGMR